MKFNQVVGQRQLKKILLSSVNSNRIGSAYIFFGSEGSGCLPLALAFAQYISCLDKREDDACGICESCVKYEKLVHPDLHLFMPRVSNSEYDGTVLNIFRKAILENPYLSIDEWNRKQNAENKQTIISVADTNNIIERLTLYNFEGKYRVVIIWGADRLQPQAAPKLLKTIEEPPENTVIILITYDIEKMLETIISRCQLFRIPPINIDEMTEYIVEKYKLSIDDAHKISSMAEGNYNTMINILQQQKMGDEYFSTFRDWMRLCYSFPKTSLELYRLIDNIIAKYNREQQKTFIQYALNEMLNFMHYKIIGKIPITANNEKIEFIKKFSLSVVSQDRLLRYSDELNKALNHVERNGNSKLIFLDLSIKINKIMKHG